MEKNNSARDVAISSSTRSESPAVLLEALSEAEERTRAKTWFCRVPSPANVADDPSRELAQASRGMGSGCIAHKLTKSLREFLTGFSRLIGVIVAGRGFEALPEWLACEPACGRPAV